LKLHPVIPHFTETRSVLDRYPINASDSLYPSITALALHSEMRWFSCSDRSARIIYIAINTDYMVTCNYQSHKLKPPLKCEQEFVAIGTLHVNK